MVYKNFRYYTEQEIDEAQMEKWVWMPAQAVRAPGVKPATYVDHGISGVWQFADAQEEIIVCNLKVPDLANRDESFYICVGWSSPAQNLFCDWEVAYLFTQIDEDTSAVAQQTLQAFCLSSLVANGLVISYFEVVPAQIHDDDVCIHTNVMRDGNDVGDTLGDVANVHGVALKYTAYRF